LPGSELQQATSTDTKEATIMFITSPSNRERDLNITLAEGQNDEETVIARIFAQLFELGGSKVEHYYGDFARDVFWMQRNFADILSGKVFFWGVRSTGTSLGFDRGEVLHLCDPFYTFRIKVEHVQKYGHKELVFTSARLG